MKHAGVKREKEREIERERDREREIERDRERERHRDSWYDTMDERALAYTKTYANGKIWYIHVM